MNLPGNSGARSKQQDAYAFVTTDTRLVLAIAEVSLAAGYFVQFRTAQAMAELYTHIARIWNTKNGTKPFSLPRKEGLWKQIDQTYLAEGLHWSVKTVGRNLKRLESCGLVAYERHGYISKKYIQLVSIEAALQVAAISPRTTNGLQAASPETQVSSTYRTLCPLGKGQVVPQVKDRLSVANTERANQEGIDKERKTLELSAERCSTPSPIRTEKGRMVRAAIRMWDEQQSAFGGLCSDAQSEEVIIAALQGSTDAEAAEYLGTGLARGWSYWSLDKPCPYGAGQLTAAVNQGWSELACDKQSPDASSCLPWISELGEFDPGDHAYGCFPHEQEPVFAPAEAPAALDKGKTPSETVEAALDAPRALSETSVTNASLPAAVQQPSPTPFVPSKPKAETRETKPKKSFQELRQEALAQAALLKSQYPDSPHSSSLNIPASNLPDVGDTYFNSIRPRQPIAANYIDYANLDF